MSQVDFEQEVLAESAKQPVLVDFWAPWCGPCRVLGPLLDKLAAETSDWKLVKINTEENPQIAQALRISGIPAVKLFSDKKIVAEFTGALPEPQLREWLAQAIPSKSRQLLQQALTALASEQTQEATKLLEQSVEQDPSNKEARAQLAKCLLSEAPERVHQLVDDIEEGDEGFDLAQSVRHLHHLTVEVANSDDPGDGWKLYREGAKAFARRDYAQALEKFLDVLKRDRKLDDDGAYKACVAIFHWLGEDHETTLEYRRKFASTLF